MTKIIEETLASDKVETNGHSEAVEPANASESRKDLKPGRCMSFEEALETAMREDDELLRRLAK